jgi:hypothetical protein
MVNAAALQQRIHEEVKCASILQYRKGMDMDNNRAGEWTTIRTSKNGIAIRSDSLTSYDPAAAATYRSDEAMTETAVELNARS